MMAVASQRIREGGLGAAAHRRDRLDAGRAQGGLAADLRPAHLEKIVSDTISLEDLPHAFDAILSGQHRGRVVVQIAGER